MRCGSPAGCSTPGTRVPLELCIEAAGAAVTAGDSELGERLALLALAGGAGAEAALLLARAHALGKRYEEAEAVLAEAEDGLISEDASYEYLEQRSVLLCWGLRRPADAVELLVHADRLVADPVPGGASPLDCAGAAGGRVGCGIRRDPRRR